MKCKNIDFGHVYWMNMLYSDVLAKNDKLLAHLVDNIIDVHAHDNNNVGYCTFMLGILSHKTPSMLQYFFNNRYINDDHFGNEHILLYINRSGVSVSPPMNKYMYLQVKQLTNYLTSISLGKFKGYYNVEKYYNMIHTMLLIIKVQKKIPTSIVKHLIIPFIYQ